MFPKNIRYHVIARTSISYSHNLQPRPLDKQRVVLRTTLQCISVANNLFHVLVTRNVEQNVKVGQQRFHNVTHAMVAHDTETPDPETTDEDEFRAKCQGLEDIACAADARVVHDVDLVADG